VVACLALDPRFAGTNSAAEGFLRAIKTVARLRSEGK
jgi:hypothetical protein